MKPTARSRSESTAPATQRPDSPGVRIPPPVIYIITFLIGLLLQFLFPLPFLSRAIALGISGVLFLGWAVLVVTSIPTLLRRGGTLNTNAASRRLVTSGVYRFTRNPMYLSLVLLYSGLACVFGVTWALPLLPPLIISTHFGVIAREERFLERTFGDDYRNYRARVRRWL